jgi:hypothetical protein
VAGRVELSLLSLVRCAAAAEVDRVLRGPSRDRADEGRALRVSRYLAPDALRHVRFSIWGGGARVRRAEAAVSLDEAEADRLVRFLTLDAEAEAEAEAAYGEDTQPSTCG